MTREGFSLFAAFRCAGRGIIDTAHERNFHIEFACMLLCIALGFGFGINPYEWLAVVVCFGLVLGGECLNSSIEAIVDLASLSIMSLLVNQKTLPLAVCCCFLWPHWLLA